MRAGRGNGRGNQNGRGKGSEIMVREVPFMINF
jgi:hypothetical protein